MTKITIRMQSETPPAAGPPDADVDVDDDRLSAAMGSPSPPLAPPPAAGGADDPSAALAALDAALAAARASPSRSNAALFRAHARSPGLFDDAHREGFLRAEEYVAKAAVDRMLAYWEARCDLFGEERMLLPMHRSSALCPEDAPALEQGMLQILPQRDAEGRALLFFDPSRRDVRLGCSTESMLRVIWYIMHVAMEDPVTRDKGFVLLVYPKRCTPEQIDRDLIAKGTAIVGSIVPLRWRGFHLCHPCSSYNKYFPLVKMLSPPAMKDNVAVHFGTDEHVLECLARHALPADRLPSDIGGGERLDYAAWLEERKRSEGPDALVAAAAAPPAAPRPPSAESAASDEPMGDAPPSPKKDAAAAKAAKPKAAAATATTRPKTKKNVRSPPTSPVADVATSAASSAAGGTTKTRRPGRKGDARMHRAVTLKIENPETSLVEALQEGGFSFEGLNEKGKPHHEVFDQDGVSLMQRKNQLLRRIRVEKKKNSQKAGDK